MSNISFIMPAKNADKYISTAIQSLESLNFKNWELIIIDDHSTDKTVKIIKSFLDERIKYFLNSGHGKVIGLNYGFEKSSGDIIKCIDSDDIVTKHFDIYINDILNNEIVCHDANLSDENLIIKTRYTVNPKILSISVEDCIDKLVSIPRCSWSFSREIAEIIFPMPETLPFEDVWFSLNIKKSDKPIKYINQPLYVYRQHDSQTFGGVLNYSNQNVMFRANRICRLIKAIEDDGRLLENKYQIKTAKIYYGLLALKDVNLKDIITAKIDFSEKIKVLLQKKLYFLAPIALKLKWKYESIFSVFFK